MKMESHAHGLLNVFSEDEHLLDNKIIQIQVVGWVEEPSIIPMNIMVKVVIPQEEMPKQILNRWWC